jgi:dolichol-phosphate mannosyltransferase
MKKIISIIIPAYNEEKNVTVIYGQLKEVVSKLVSKYTFEIIYINDGSIDDTWLTICDLNKKDKSVKGINFSRNFGHQAALQAGLEYAAGDAVISIDADMQQPTQLIPKLLESWEQGNIIVNTIRRNTQKAGLFKIVTSKAFYFMLNIFSNLRMQEGEADFRLIDRKVLDIINKLPETPKFYRGIVKWVGFKHAYIEYTASARVHGKSSYSLRKMLELARIGMTSFSMMPLKIIFGIGTLITLVSGIELVFLTYLKLFVGFGYVSNTFLLASIILFSTGILIMFQGILAVYFIDIYNSSKNRPSYIISDEFGIRKQ